MVEVVALLLAVQAFFLGYRVYVLTQRVASLERSRESLEAGAGRAAEIVAGIIARSDAEQRG